MRRQTHNKEQIYQKLLLYCVYYQKFFIINKWNYFSNLFISVYAHALCQQCHRHDDGGGDALLPLHSTLVA